MLSQQDLSLIHRHAYIPEHLPDYVESISTAKPHLIENHLCFIRRNHLLFIGYGLGVDIQNMASAYTAACNRFQPLSVAIIAPELWETGESFEKQETDSYYRLDLKFSNAFQLLELEEHEIEKPNGDVGAPPAFMDGE